MRLVWSFLLALALAVGAVLAFNQRGQAQDLPLLLVTTQDVIFLAPGGQNTVDSVTVGLASSGPPITWTASISPTVGWLALGTTQGIAPTVPAQPIELPIYLQTLGLPRGEYAAQIVVTANGRAANSPLIIPVTLYVADPLRQVYLPLILKRQER